MSRQRLDPDREARFWDGVAQATRFFMGEADVQRALDKLVRLLDDARIPYAIVGAMALNEYGYRRVTVDVDILLTPPGWSRSGHWQSAAAPPSSSRAVDACATSNMAS